MRLIARLIRRAVLAGSVLLLATLAAVIYLEARTAREAGAEALSAPVEVAIVLGAGVDGDGRLAYASRRRVAGAVALLESGKAERLIFSGGLGGNHPETPAAMLMRDHALALGARPEALSVEPHSTTTFENLRFSFAMTEAQGAGRLALVSDPYHLPRAALLARVLGQPGVERVAVPGVETVWWPYRGVALMREALAWWLNLGKCAVWEGLGLIDMPPERRGEWVR